MLALSQRLFGTSQAIADFPRRKDLRGIGLSDARCYARRLRRRLAYRNTYYHRWPKLDLLDPPRRQLGKCDFLIASDVLEHIPPPVDRAFESISRLLAVGGVAVLSVPYALTGETVEHYPRLHRFRIVGKGADRVVENITRDGRREVYSDPVFHDGAGSTLEMRLFSLEGLLGSVQAAGLTDVRVHDADSPEFGIVHENRCSHVLTAVKRG
ncbi:MAG: hypothetical protein KDC87_16980 [Planctomycetes bacterium]|nr:hypothetical protein [Planctomycetota bacterium]MCB9871099.1 hypothetical protein [Planctomycetota bacterium]MCB9888263.1 hypothetical protein [Planctomycetota bacterium]